jgi:hypothetical protein
MGKSLFIGNGVNLLTYDASWLNLLERLAEFPPEPEHDLIRRDIVRKPFTLVFEEIFLRSARTCHTTELREPRELELAFRSFLKSLPRFRVYDARSGSETTGLRVRDAVDTWIRAPDECFTASATATTEMHCGQIAVCVGIF